MKSQEILAAAVSSGFVFGHKTDQTDQNGKKKVVHAIETDKDGNILCSQDDVPEKKKNSFLSIKEVIEFSLDPMFSRGRDIFDRGFPLLLDALGSNKKRRTDPFRPGGSRAYKDGVPPHSYLRKTNQWKWSD